MRAGWRLRDDRLERVTFVHRDVGQDLPVQFDTRQLAPVHELRIGQALGPDATNAWAKRIVDATKSQVESGAKNFEAAANRIVTSSGGSSPAKK